MKEERKPTQRVGHPSSTFDLVTVNGDGVAFGGNVTASPGVLIGFEVSGCAYISGTFSVFALVPGM